MRERVANGVHAPRLNGAAGDGRTRGAHAFPICDPSGRALAIASSTEPDESHQENQPTSLTVNNGYTVPDLAHSAHDAARPSNYVGCCRSIRRTCWGTLGVVELSEHRSRAKRTATTFLVTATPQAVPDLKSAPLSILLSPEVFSAASSDGMATVQNIAAVGLTFPKVGPAVTVRVVAVAEPWAPTKP